MFLSFILIVAAVATTVNAFGTQQQRNRMKTSEIVDSFPTRRQLIFQQTPSLIASIILMSTDSPHALAFGEGAERMLFTEKPTAPLEALLPAIQQRLLLEVALELVKDAMKDDDDSNVALLKLKTILPPLDEVPKFNNQNGKQNSRVLKQYPPDKVLRGDVVRAVMNVYQLNLNYDNLRNMNPREAIQITDAEWKKKYIRANDGLPDLQKIVGADIDMRQLLRNQAQMNIDDAAAELWFVSTNKSGGSNGCDIQELNSLLQEAARNYDLWLDRVRSGDIQDAIDLLTGGGIFRNQGT